MAISAPSFGNLNHLACNSSSFSYPDLPELAGVRFQSLEATQRFIPYQLVPAGLYSNHGTVIATNTSLCNVTMVYFPPDNPDPTTVQIWLPDKEWNGRIQAIGGSGWAAGINDYSDYQMTAAVFQGYAAIITNGGWPTNEPENYVLKTDGTVNMQSLLHYASTCLNDLSLLGKSIVQQFYHQPAHHAYWNGCSQGGRQGFALAQLYPHAFDGIVASAPPVHWEYLMPAGMWSQVFQHNQHGWINPCELTTLSALALAHCDANDGVADGLIADPDNCTFNPFSVVGQATDCFGAPAGRISRNAAALALAGWTGMNESRVEYMHRPTNYESQFVTSGSPLAMQISTAVKMASGLADRVCDAGGEHCQGRPFKMVADWFRFFLKKDADYDVGSLTLAEFDDSFNQSVTEYTQVIGTGKADLSAYKKVGGKILTYHGLADPIIPSRNTRSYYEEVGTLDPEVHKFFKYYEAPGVGHCFNGHGIFPHGIFDAMVDWVEKGKEPEELHADISTFGVIKKERILCPYPTKARYDRKGHPDSKDSYSCR